MTPKKVGPGGCLVSVLLFILSIVAFFGLVVWATVGVVNDLQSAPSVPLGSSGTVNITTTGTQYLFLGDLDSGGTIPAVDPVVTVTGPGGANLPVRSSTATSSGSSGGATFRSIGEFTAATAGTYTIDTTDAPAFRNAKVYVSSLNVGSLGAKLLLAFGIGGLLFVASVILAIVWLVRRSKAKKSVPPYQGGHPGGGNPAVGYPGGGYQGGGYPPQPGSPQPGGWPQNPPTGGNV
jgi:hypothetical protein